MNNLDHRARQILDHIIEHYINTAEPVGSRVLSKLMESKLSAATIRNIMSDLTEMGLIAQPHISAGRIPTDLGYRYYINQILSSDETKATKKKKIRQTFSEYQAQRLEDILITISDELSNATECTSIIISPQPTTSKLRKIEFINLNDRQLLSILVTQIGMVRNKIISMRECPDQETLDKIAELLGEFFKEKNLTEIRSSLVDTLTNHMDGYDELLVQAIKIGKKAFELDINNEVFILGRSRMCSFPEFSDQESLRLVFGVLDDKQALFNTLISVMEREGIHIRIGNENKYDGLGQCSVIAGTYGNRGYLLGSLGVIGPKRIDYNRIINEIDHSAQKLSYALTQFLENK